MTLDDLSPDQLLLAQVIADGLPYDDAQEVAIDRDLHRLCSALCDPAVRERNGVLVRTRQCLPAAHTSPL